MNDEILKLHESDTKQLIFLQELGSIVFGKIDQLEKRLKILEQKESEK